ncbi:hypothetical protein D3C83_208090 [compost metagenome]
MGEGMVDWAAYFGMLRAARFNGRVSLHLEYEIGGATAAEKEAKTIEAAGRDLKFLEDQLQAAYKS